MVGEKIQYKNLTHQMYRVSQKNSALDLLQQQANALFLLGHPVALENPDYFVKW